MDNNTYENKHQGYGQQPRNAGGYNAGGGSYDQYNKPPSSRGNKPSYSHNARGAAGGGNYDHYEESKYQPQKREAPGRQMNNGGMNGGYGQQHGK